MIMPRLLNEGLKENVFDLCKRIAGSHQIIAACFYGPWVCGYADKKSDVHVLLVLDNFRSKLRSYLKPLNEINVFILTVDQGAFEGDVNQGLLGEFVTEKITFPYEPLISEEYLRRQEVKAKKRIILELLENIVLEFPELSHELLIQVEYFMYEAMKRRARVFLPVTYTFLNMLRGDVRKKNVESMMRGYLEALSELAKEGQIIFPNGHVKITKNLMNAISGRKFRLPLFLKSFQKAALLYILSILPKMMRPLVYDEEVFMRSNRGVKAEELVFQLEDPKKYLLIPTSLGFVTLSDKTGIEDFVRKAVPGEVLDMKIEEVGGVLNAVYLLTFQRNREKQKVIVKKFKDWYGFKWFPLALWALGTKTFAVLGRSRLEREYAVNQFLHSQGFPVPAILYFSPKQKLIFKNFIEGESLTKIIKRIISSKKKVTAEAALVREVGRRIAEAHRLGVALGDCKPENIIVTKDGKTFFVDLEQATRNGDGNQAWDVAEFLYYSGHYVSPVSSANAAVVIAKEFIRGYLEAGGKREMVRKAGTARYTKVFSIFTPPQVLLAVSNICKRIGKNDNVTRTKFNR